MITVGELGGVRGRLRPVLARLLQLLLQRAGFRSGLIGRTQGFGKDTFGFVGGLARLLGLGFGQLQLRFGLAGFCLGGARGFARAAGCSYQTPCMLASRGSGLFECFEFQGRETPFMVVPIAGLFRRISANLAERQVGLACRWVRNEAGSGFSFREADHEKAFSRAAAADEYLLESEQV